MTFPGKFFASHLMLHFSASLFPLKQEVLNMDQRKDRFPVFRKIYNRWSVTFFPARGAVRKLRTLSGIKTGLKMGAYKIRHRLVSSKEIS
jgi:hypothetical protein